MKKILFLLLILVSTYAHAAYVLIPMDESQKNHLKAYGIAYYALQKNIDVKWLLNYRGGSFLLADVPELEKECAIRGVSMQIIADAQAVAITNEILNPEVNMDIMK